MLGVGAAERGASIRPIQQLIGHVSSQESQNQWGNPLFQFGIVNARPMTSPRMKNQRTWRPGRFGAKRAHTQAQSEASSDEEV